MLRYKITCQYRVLDITRLRKALRAACPIMYRDNLQAVCTCMHIETQIELHFFKSFDEEKVPIANAPFIVAWPDPASVRHANCR